jgi:hypothetical protein
VLVLMNVNLSLSLSHTHTGDTREVDLNELVPLTSPPSPRATGVYVVCVYCAVWLSVQLCCVCVYCVVLGVCITHRTAPLINIFFFVHYTLHYTAYSSQQQVRQIRTRHWYDIWVLVQLPRVRVRHKRQMDVQAAHGKP